MSDDKTSALIGDTISGRYRIGEPIASGGMGAVFRGEHLHMRKHVAIKILHAETEGLEGLAAQFEREAVAGAHIDHPNVASATDFGERDDGSFFLVLEYVKGDTLESVLKKGPISVDRVLNIAGQIAAGLHAAHAKGIVHRDVKSANVMLTTQEGEELAKLIDFGFAKVPVGRLSLAGDDDPLSKEDHDADTVFGTIHYLSPEAAGGMDKLDARSDLYGLGIIMYEMLTGKRPFDGDTAPVVFKHHRETPPPPFIERAPMIPVPASLEAVVMRLLEKNPDDRFQSGEAVIAALDRVAAAKKMATRSQVDLSDIDIPPPRRSRLSQLVMLTVILGGLAAVVWFIPSARNKAIELGLPLPPPGASGAAGDDDPKVTEVDGLGASAWTAKLLEAPKTKKWDEGAKALAALAQLDDTALSTDQMIQAAAAVAVGVGHPKHAAHADAVFKTLAEGFGSDGLDALYYIVDTQAPAHPAAKRALETLQQPSTLEKASPALRVAVELRVADCQAKAPLFGRAASDGDARALKILKPLRFQPCRKGPKDPCCFRANVDLEATLATLGARVAKQK